MPTSGSDILSIDKELINKKSDAQETLRLCRQMVATIVDPYVSACVPSEDGSSFRPPNEENIEPVAIDSQQHASLRIYQFTLSAACNTDQAIATREIARSVQFHDKKHRKTCFKKGNFCRFHYPRKCRCHIEIKFIKLKGKYNITVILILR